MSAKLAATGKTSALPCAEEQYGTRSLQLRRYACDHTGVKRAKISGGQWLWSDVQKFIKVESLVNVNHCGASLNEYIGY